MLKFYLFIFISLFAYTLATNVKKCKNGQPFPLSVNIEGCDEPPCMVIKGTTAVMHVHFLGTREVSKKLYTKINAKTFGITVPYDLPNDVADVCRNLMYEAMCPIYKTEDVVYKLDFFIDSIYPEITVGLEVSLKDEHNETIACFICNIKVRKGAINPVLLE